MLENTDWNAVDSIMEMKGLNDRPPEIRANIRAGYARGMGGLPLTGSPDAVAKYARRNFRRRLQRHRDFVRQLSRRTAVFPRRGVCRGSNGSDFAHPHRRIHDPSRSRARRSSPAPRRSPPRAPLLAPRRRSARDSRRARFRPTSARSSRTRTISATLKMPGSTCRSR